jgi:hypothetical protein
MLVRLDGAGFSHELLEHIAAGGKVKGRNWEFSAGWSCTDRETDAIAQLPDEGWTAAIEQNGEPVANAYVAELTGLLDLQAGSRESRTAGPGSRRTTAPPLPQTGHRPREGPRPPIPADRHQLPGRVDRLAGCPPPLPRARRERRQTGQGPRPQQLALPILDDQRHLDPDHRPGREPAGLLPPARPPRRRPARRRPETAALPAVAAPRTAHPRATQTVAAPPRGLALDHRRDQYLAGRQDTARTALTPPHPDDHEKDPDRSVEPGAPTRQSDHDPTHRQKDHDRNYKVVVQARTCHHPGQRLATARSRAPPE